MANKATYKNKMVTSTPFSAKGSTTSKETPVSLHSSGSSNRNDDSGYFSPSPNVTSKGLPLKSSLPKSHPECTPQLMQKNYSKLKCTDLNQISCQTVKDVVPSFPGQTQKPTLSQNFARLRDNPKHESLRNDNSEYFSPSPNVTSKDLPLKLPLPGSRSEGTPQLMQKNYSKLKRPGPSQTISNVAPSLPGPARMPTLSQNFDRLRSNPKHGLLKKKADWCRTVWQTTGCNLHVPGSLVKVDHVDFMAKLDSFNMGVIVSQILENVGSRDLCSICCASKTWKSVCLKDQSASGRRKAYLDMTRREKENNQAGASLVKGGTRKPSNQKLDEIQNVLLNENLAADSGKEEPKTQSEQRFRRFVEEGQRLQSNERLDKCPRCSSPARVNMVQKRAKCSLNGCEFDYCTLCRLDYRIPHTCSPLRPGSRRNRSTSKKNVKRNLRRLLS